MTKYTRQVLDNELLAMRLRELLPHTFIQVLPAMHKHRWHIRYRLQGKNGPCDATFGSCAAMTVTECSHVLEGMIAAAATAR